VKTDFMADYEPDPHDRTYYRRARDDQLGWMIRRDGVDYIKLDRPSKETLEPYRPNNWIEDREHRTLTDIQRAQIAFAADVKLCSLLGEHDLARREWIMMSDAERRDWIEEGPSDRKERVDLWMAIMEKMTGHSR